MYRLAAHIHACLVGETPVLLDAAAGRYRLVRGQTGRDLAAFLQGDESETACEPLLRAGLLVSGPARIDRLSGADAPTYSHLTDVRLREGWTLFPIAAVLILLAMARVRRTAFHILIDDLRREGERPGWRASGLIGEARIAAAFCLAQRFLPLKDRCLPYSIATARMLRWLGHCPLIIIGVRLPIGAHCWVQCERRLVGDTLDRVNAFQPILTL